MRNVAINGMGRIGRLVFKKLLEKPNELRILAVNDLTPPKTLAYLLNYDSIHPSLPSPVRAQEDYLVVGEQKIKVFSQPHPEQLPWHDYDISLVIEASGRFASEEKASAHLQAGAHQVLITAYAKENVPTVVMGVNDSEIDFTSPLISNASCTTNCIAPMIKVIDDSFGIKEGYMTTIHAYTSDQRLHDAPHTDLRRARAAALSIIPTSTGATQAVGEVLPHLKGKLQGIAMRVPVPCGSIADVVVACAQAPEVQEINEQMKQAAQTSLKNILSYQEAPLVSADIVGSPYSCVFDATLTSVQNNLLKIVGWYDNEVGYAQRIVDIAHLMRIK